MTLKAYLPDLALLLAGLGAMALLLYLGAASEGWLPPLCFLGAAVVYTGWYRVLLRLARRYWGIDDNDEDQPFFPG